MNGADVTLTLRLRIAGDTLTGEAISPSGRSMRFTGRLGLMCAVDALIGDGDRPSGPCEPAPQTNHAKEMT